MKKTLLLVVLIHLYFAATGFATIKTINVQNFSFSPANTSAFVGDTIKFQWLNGTHTTTCNGTSGSTLPAGATPWNSPIQSSSPTFFYVLGTAGQYHFVCIPHAPSMSGNITATISGINPVNALLPENFSLSQNFPNPFNRETKINFNIAKAGLTKLTVYNAAGKEIAELVNEDLTEGSYSVNFNAMNLSTGVYFYRLQAEGFSEIKKMTLIK